MGRSEDLFERAVKRIPGGVNSPVRAYGAIGMAPRFIKRADGCYIYDVDGNKYIDYIDSWGPMILGHNFPAVRESVLKACENGLSFGCATEIEVEMAEFICEHIPHVEMVRMVNSGTEAVMSAIRAARGFTGKDKIIKFAGCYHGHSDALLVSAGSGVMTSGVPDSAGVPKGVDWDPNGERNPQNRGISKYERISWDDACDIIAAEIKRIQDECGPFSIYAQSDGHGETKTVHAAHGCQTNLLALTDRKSVV